MKNLISLAAAAAFSVFAMSVRGQGTAFTYQGTLSQGGVAANGLYDFSFAAFNALSAGSQIGSTVTSPDILVSNGQFKATIDFGTGVFDGSPRWLEISVRTNGAATFTPLGLRQELTPAPYAIFAGRAATANSANWNNLVGSPLLFTSNSISTFGSNILELQVSGVTGLRLEPDPRGANVPNLIGGWFQNGISTNGAGGSVIVGGGYNGIPNSIQDFSSGVFIGAGSLNLVSSNSSDSVIVGGYGNTVGAARSVVGGGANNIADGGESFIGGGSANSTSNSLASVLGGFQNSARGYASSIGGGGGNIIRTNADYTVIGGGYGNQIEAIAFVNNLGGYNSIIGGGLFNTNRSPYSTISGGSYGFVGTNSNSAVIGGGYYNRVQDNSFDCTISGGSYHNIGTNSGYSTISGGTGQSIGTNSGLSTIGGGQNLIGDNAFGSTIGGGLQNNIQSGGYEGSVGGGYANAVSGAYATVPGGYSNLASGLFSFAAGHQAKAVHNGAFVWADSTAGDFSSTAADQFLIRASGGVGIGLNNPVSALQVNGVVTASGFSGDGSGLTLNASQISSGTVADSHLSPNVALLNTAQTFTAPKSFSSGISVSTSSGTGLSFGAGNGPLITAGLFNSTTVSNRMWIGHSESYPTWGIQYRDWDSDGMPADSIEFVAGNTARPSFGFVLGSRLLQGYNGAGVTNLQLNAASGRLGLGLVPSSYQLQLSTDSAGKPNGGSWANSSDARIKKNIHPLTGALNKLGRIRGVTFEWINPEDHADQTGTQGGFIAQDIEKVFPNWVQKVPGAEHDRSLTPDGKIKSLSLPFEFDALVVEALRELRTEKDAQIARLENELKAQKQTAARLESRLDALERALASSRPKSSSSPAELVGR